MKRVWFVGGPLDGQLRRFQGELPLVFTEAEAVTSGPGFQRGHVYKLSLKTNDEAQYVYDGSTSHVAPQKGDA